MRVSSVSDMKGLDSKAVKEYGIDEILLMENAGNAVFFVVLNKFDIKDKKVLIICGSGNNGGDGMVVARKLYSHGASVDLVLLNEEEKLKGINKRNFEIIKKIGIPVKKMPGDKILKKLLSASDIIIDGLLGTGLKGNVRGKHKKVIEFINESKKTVISIDIPSGINGNTGEVMGTAVKSDYTITFGLPKIGNINYPGYEHCGQLYISHISFPVQLYENSSIKNYINEPLVISDRRMDIHKGICGKALFISGSRKYLGAPYFSSISFLKAGGGLSYLATPSSISSHIASKGPEIVLLPLNETVQGTLSSDNLNSILKYSEDVDIVVLGPGLSTESETCKLVIELTEKISKPLLIDGDGITAVKDNLDIIKKREYPTVITPHPGEFSRLTKKNIKEIKKNRVGLVRDFSKDYDCITVLKGAHSLIGLPEGRVYFNMTGNPGMATAGSGDVLTGTIAALYRAFPKPDDNLSLSIAVRMGVLIHGYSGDIASAEIGHDGITAGDILKFLPAAMKEYRTNPENLYPDIKVI